MNRQRKGWPRPGFDQAGANIGWQNKPTPCRWFMLLVLISADPSGTCSRLTGDVRLVSSAIVPGSRQRTQN
jgi:hypothetical protein